MVDPNTRQGKRTPVTLKIKFKSETLEQFIERYAVDVSQGGIFIRTKDPLAVGTQMKFEFQLRDASPLIAGEGTVVWTRENDPSRPAIAPGMGVRFDRLAEGSQLVLERILAEKAKQAPQRPAESQKPPLFTDTPTRVAPAPVQDALLGQESAASQRPRKRPDSYNEQTPLPKPMPFHSDADEFPDEAFEEATKVRALDELIAQTAEGSTNGMPVVPSLAPRRSGPTVRTDSSADTVASDRAITRAETENQSAPALPSPPEPATRAQPRLLDTSPSPRTEGAGATLQMGSGVASLPEAMARTRLGVEPAGAIARGRVSTPPHSIPVPPSAASESSMSTRMPAHKSSNAAMIIISLLVVAAAGAAVWFFVLRPKEEEKKAAVGSGSGSAGSSSVGSAGSAGSGSAQQVAGSNTGGSGSAGSATQAPPKGPLVETQITSSVEKSTVEVVGTDQTGPAPLAAKLEKDKTYKAWVSAPGYVRLEIEVKGGEKPAPAKLVAKQRMITVTSDPPGAVITVDDKSTGHSTPFDVELTAAQAAKKMVRVGLRKPGYRYIEKPVDLSKLVEDDTRMVGKVDEKLAVQTVVIRTPPPPPHDAGGAGSGSEGPITSPDGSGTPANGGSGHEAGSAHDPGGAGSGQPQKGSAAEPEPDFNKQP